MNKKGMFFATFSILMVFSMIITYSFINEKKEMRAGIDDLGKTSISLIKINLEGEKLKFFIEEAIGVARNLALKDVKENVGVYNKENCGIWGGYVVLEDGCDYLDPENGFYYYFNDSFDIVLKSYDRDLNSDDFEIEVLNNVLGVEGVKVIPLSMEKVSTESKLDMELDHDNILEYVKKYAEFYDVDENLIKAVIMQESGGNPDAFSGSSYGVMQINRGAHPGWFNGSMGCYADNDVECNIKAGVSILRGKYEIYKSGNYENVILCSIEPMRSKFLCYRDWKAALRLYNGGQCGCATCDDDYVEKVWGKYSGRSVERIGFIDVKIDYEEGVDFDFGSISDVVLRGRAIRDCVGDLGEDAGQSDIDVCAGREDNMWHIFKAKREGNILRFDVEELQTGDSIKFALSI